MSSVTIVVMVAHSLPARPTFSPLKRGLKLWSKNEDRNAVFAPMKRGLPAIVAGERKRTERVDAMRFDANNQVIPESMTPREAAQFEVNYAVMEDARFPSARELAADIRELHERGYGKALDAVTPDDIDRASDDDPRGYVAALLVAGFTIPQICNRDYSSAT